MARRKALRRRNVPVQFECHACGHEWSELASLEPIVCPACGQGARKPELGCAVFHCSGCGVYMDSKNRDRTFTREVLDAHVYEIKTLGIMRCQHCPPEHVVERQGIDLNRYTLEKILPGAAQMCEEGQQREIAAQRDLKPHENNVIMLTELRGLPMQLINGILQEPRGFFRTASQLPHGVEPIVGRNEAQIRITYARVLQRKRIAKNWPEALRMANGNAIRFVFVGGGVEMPL